MLHVFWCSSITEKKYYILLLEVLFFTFQFRHLGKKKLKKKKGTKKQTNKKPPLQTISLNSVGFKAI